MRFGSYHSPVVIALIFVAGLLTPLSLVPLVTSGWRGVPSTASIDPFAYASGTAAP
jgi:hypothetical protein